MSGIFSFTACSLVRTPPRGRANKARRAVALADLPSGLQRLSNEAVAQIKRLRPFRGGGWGWGPSNNAAPRMTPPLPTLSPKGERAMRDARSVPLANSDGKRYD